MIPKFALLLCLALQPGQQCQVLALTSTRAQCETRLKTATAPAQRPRLHCAVVDQVKTGGRGGAV